MSAAILNDANYTEFVVFWQNQSLWLFFDLEHAIAF